MKKALLRSGTVKLQAKRPLGAHASDLAADRGLANLSSALEHPDPDVRARAVTIASAFSDGRIRRLLRATMYDPCPAVRCAAIRAAGGAESLDLVASLLVALRDPDANVRHAAAEAVSTITGRPIGPTATDATIDATRLEELKLWWKEQRRAELEAPGNAERARGSKGD